MDAWSRTVRRHDDGLPAARAGRRRQRPGGRLLGFEFELGDIANHAQQAYFYGYAHENVRRVALRPGGKQYGAQTFTAWPGSGLRLWAFPVPSSMLLSSSPSRVLLGYDAAGRVVWLKNLLAR